MKPVEVVPACSTAVNNDERWHEVALKNAIDQTTTTHFKGTALKKQEFEMVPDSTWPDILLKNLSTENFPIFRLINLTSAEIEKHDWS